MSAIQKAILMILAAIGSIVVGVWLIEWTVNYTPPALKARTAIDAIEDYSVGEFTAFAKGDRVQSVHEGTKVPKGALGTVLETPLDIDPNAKWYCASGTYYVYFDKYPQMKPPLQGLCMSPFEIAKHKP